MRLIAFAAVALASAPAAAQSLSAADTAAAFRAAGFKQVGGKWKNCDDEGALSSSAGTVEVVRDLNGDGLPEAMLAEGGTYCYGMTGAGFFLVSKQKAGGWKLVNQGIGMVSILATKGVGGWPDLEIGGPGFCFPVQRWNGTEYRLHRQQYEGKPCRRN